ncbi:MAG: aminotransferase class I/II-fold pyridoxal phosphate-dependent enzyme, partial [Desulfitobacteriaceae bacterium]|nr:aminotransferase class I/II-fold pyridoxal phosphate-dependent enzyme [Desulfitobacteriaceae bacterium]MDD4754268.1 aminotransferase class I/II-fold pyridoxal phosphate-dependent enzyme [Desulfitobacteriaceae bacterium]
DYINASQRWITEERNYLYQQLREIAGLTVYPSKANYHLVRIDRSGIDAWRLKDLLIEKGILIRTPDGFNYLSSSHVRLAVKDRHANKELVKSLREILS